MQVVSGPLGRERAHFGAPDAARVPQEMERFLGWLEGGPDLDPLIRAGLAHFCLVTVHPFEDGNGRIARALTELLLIRADGLSYRSYSLSRQIEQGRRGYCGILEGTQASQDMDVTPWLDWFLWKLDLALQETEQQQEEVRLRQA